MVKTFTIFVKDPNTATPMPATPNCAGQLIAFDGKTTKAQALHLARLCADTYDHVSVFAGKNLGRQIAVFTKGKTDADLSCIAEL